MRLPSIQYRSKRLAQKSGLLPDRLQWISCTRKEVPSFIRERLDPQMAEGAGWKFATLRPFPDLFKIAMDNDLVLWRIPNAMFQWLAPENLVSNGLNLKSVQ